MPIISTEKLQAVNKNIARPDVNNSRNYLMYPINMKSDRSINNREVEGQDRIHFELKQYAKKNDNLIGPKKGSEEFPFPATKERNKETDQYIKAAIQIGGSTVGDVFLPIQDKIQDTNAVTWGDGTLNDLQRRIANLSYNMMADNNVQVDESLNAMTSLVKDSSIGDLGRLYLTEQIIGVQGLFSRATGKILNPNLELLFSTPTLRPFTFNFKLSPRDEEEGAEVKKIIRFFKQGMAPRVQSNNLFLNAPYVFSIKYMMGNRKEHGGIGKIKHCALQNCTVDYTPNNTYMTYQDGTMISYNINMTFQEIVPVYDEDYVTPENVNHPIGF
jgi:hypothetical protein